jgi:hypothetical protein
MTRSYLKRIGLRLEDVRPYELEEAEARLRARAEARAIARQERRLHLRLVCAAGATAELPGSLNQGAMPYSRAQVPESTAETGSAADAGAGAGGVSGISGIGGAEGPTT